MPMVFYPHEDDVQTPLLQEKLETLMEAAERYKAVILDQSASQKEKSEEAKKIMVPREILTAYNWDEIAKLLKIIRELPEASQSSKAIKAERLTKLAEIYEVLRAAKMPKLEAVRVALVSEASQLRSNTPGAAA